VSLFGFALLLHGFSQAGLTAALLWSPPPWGRAATVALMLPVMLLLLAEALPRSHLRQALAYPAHWAILLFAAAHLLANARLHHLLLFGSFGLWAAIALACRYRRERESPADAVPATGMASLINLLAGTALWYAFARWLHLWLIGVAPLG
jgi:uncharacterized membrane protein